ncbi:MAG: bacillithiol biosynthesis cysteine-adding enzyme BshC [Anaerolineales bacterium]
MIVDVDWEEIPQRLRRKFYLDYVEGKGKASSFFTHEPTDYEAALTHREAYDYPRRELVEQLLRYNRQLGAGEQALTNIRSLQQPSTFCVIAGQQVGFLGGPMYTTYKIISTIRLAAHLNQTLPVHTVPMFWMATEDHDFDEINHVYYFQPDGEMGQLDFSWDKQGSPIADLGITEEIEDAFQTYFDRLTPGTHHAATRDRFAPQEGEDYCTWHGRLWSSLFADYGLVIVEPRILRPLGAHIFQAALKRTKEMTYRLQGVAKDLAAADYEVLLPVEDAGRPFTFDAQGNRVRVQEPAVHVDKASSHPERYSTDAALRPLFADAILPIVVSVLGPGEITYHAMLKPLYDLFDIPQPLFFPRKSYTLVRGSERDNMERYGITPKQLLTREPDPSDVLNEFTFESGTDLFGVAREQVEKAFAPLRPYVKDIDPSMTRSWEWAVNNALRGINKLEESSTRALMSQKGLSKGEIHVLQNVVLPRDRLQERVLPLPHFTNIHGLGLVDELATAGALDDFRHHILVVEEKDARD